MAIELVSPSCRQANALLSTPTLFAIFVYTTFSPASIVDIALGAASIGPILGVCGSIWWCWLVWFWCARPGTLQSWACCSPGHAAVRHGIDVIGGAFIERFYSPPCFLPRPPALLGWIQAVPHSRRRESHCQVPTNEIRPCVPRANQVSLFYSPQHRPPTIFHKQAKQATGQGLGSGISEA